MEATRERADGGTDKRRYISRDSPIDLDLRLSTPGHWSLTATSVTGVQASLGFELVIGTRTLGRQPERLPTGVAVVIGPEDPGSASFWQRQYRIPMFSEALSVSLPAADIERLLPRLKALAAGALGSLPSDKKDELAWVAASPQADELVASFSRLSKNARVSRHAYRRAGPSTDELYFKRNGLLGEQQQIEATRSMPAIQALLSAQMAALEALISADQASKAAVGVFVRPGTPEQDLPENDWRVGSTVGQELPKADRNRWARRPLGPICGATSEPYQLSIRVDATTLSRDISRVEAVLRQKGVPLPAECDRFALMTSAMDGLKNAYTDLYWVPRGKMALVRNSLARIGKVIWEGPTDAASWNAIESFTPEKFEALRTDLRANRIQLGQAPLLKRLVEAEIQRLAPHAEAFSRTAQKDLLLIAIFYDPNPASPD